MLPGGPFEVCDVTSLTRTYNVFPPLVVKNDYRLWENIKAMQLLCNGWSNHLQIFRRFRLEPKDCFYLMLLFNGSWLVYHWGFKYIACVTELVAKGCTIPAGLGHLSPRVFHEKGETFHYMLFLLTLSSRSVILQAPNWACNRVSSKGMHNTRRLRPS